MSLARSGDIICDCCGSVIEKNNKNNTITLCKECKDTMKRIQPETD